MVSPSPGDHALTKFRQHFREIQGKPDPFPWQERLFYEHFLIGDLPSALDLPTGLGKTSVMTIWLLARLLAEDKARSKLPRRLVYVVDRRTVVDQATTEAEKLRQWLYEKSSLKPKLGLGDRDLPISTLRGQKVDNREWLADPTAPAIIVGTVDMIGSRLLFSGYGVSRRMRPYHAGLLGADTLVVLDEAHLVPPFEALLRAIAGDPDRTLGPASEDGRAQDDREPDDGVRVPGFRLMSLSATGRNDDGAPAFRLTEADDKHAVVNERLHASKQLKLDEAPSSRALVDELVQRAWTLATDPRPARVIVYCDRRENAKSVKDKIDALAKKEKIDAPTELLVGERRVHEREKLFEWLKEHGFIEGDGKSPELPTFLVATSAGEVGVDLDADHMVCDLVEWERMVQRLGRVNRRGGENRNATIGIVAAPPKTEKKDGEEWPDRLKRLRKPIDALKGDGSPAAIAKLKQDENLKGALDEAQTPAPLHPALTRALVDAWSMTSLEEHTGRPEIQPWLRGWEKDEEPQTTVAWRRWLPWHAGSDKPIPQDVQDFFRAAPVHLEETLEAPTWRVLQWLTARAAAVLKAADSADEESAMPKLTADSPGLIVLDRRGSFEDSEEAWTIGKLASLGSKERRRDKEGLSNRLSGRTLVVSSLLGGLTEDGMLDESKLEAASVLDDGWSEEALYKRIGYRVVRVAGEDAPGVDSTRWKLDTTLYLSRPEDTESESVICLRVYVARGDRAARAGDQAIARRPQSLDEHHKMVAAAACEIAAALGFAQPYREMLDWVARHHDLGKARDLWQNAMAFKERREGRPYAKSTRGDGRRLNGYRHEFGSLRDVEQNGAFAQIEHLGEDLHDLALHLIASHHGWARPVINTYDPLGPNEYEPSIVAQARARDAALRFARLQRRWGPWGLAWWEALLRAADQQASRRHDEGAS